MTELVSAKERYLADFRALAENGAAASPPWLRQVREAAIGRFAELGFPTMRQEEWRFTDVAPIVETPFTVARARRADACSPADIAHLLLAGGRGHRAVFVNGVYAAPLSRLSGLPAGLRMGSLAAALESDPDLLHQHLARHAAFDKNPFTALSTAFIGDGAFVYVAPGTVVDEPLQLIFVSTPSPARRLCYARNLLVVDREARATVVETYAALADDTYLTNAVTELVVGDGARASYHRIQRESERAYHVATTHSSQGRNSVLASCVIALGGALSRHDVVAVLRGAGGALTLDGLSVLRGAQHVDHHTVIEHAEPHCESHEHFNGIFGDRSRGVFNGRIVVRPGAQRTDAKQTNNNLLLSELARADSQPQLEIYADDVKCTHGATLGPLDENATYYLRSRGIGVAEARTLLTYGFGAEILTRVSNAEVREQFDRLLQDRLDEGAARPDAPAAARDASL